MIIVTDSDEIKTAIEAFRKNIQGIATNISKSKIGYPSGNYAGTIMLLQEYDMWICIAKFDSDENKIWTAYGYGGVDEKGMNNITVEINPSLIGSHSVQGYLLEENGEYYLAHSGKVNIGYGKKVNIESNYFVKKKYKDIDEKTKDLFCISKILDKKNVTSRQSLYEISKYVKEVRLIKDNQKPQIKVTEDASITADNEGGKELSDVWVYKRSAKLVKERKKRDKYTCQICEFYYENAIVHVHHINPISNKNEATLTDISELITLCPNCHAIVHQLIRSGDKKWAEVKQELRILMRGKVAVKAV